MTDKPKTPAKYGEPLKVLSDQEAMRACTPEELAENARRQYEHHQAYMADPAREERLLAHMLRREAEVDAILYPPRRGLMKWLFG